MAGASKDVLKEYRSKWNSINDYLFDDKYSSICGLLKDSDVVVASREYAIICNNLSSVVSRINYSSNVIEELFEKIYGNSVKIVAISGDEWNKTKNEYINNIKNGNKYLFQPLNENKDVEITNTPVDDLINLVGDNIIEYK